MFAKTSKIAEARAEQARIVHAHVAHTAAGAGTEISLVSGDCLVFGELFGAEDIRIDGTVEGNVVAPNVTVGKNAQIEGAIYAETVRVEGTVNGRIEAIIVSIAKSANVVAVIYHNTLSIEFGATVEGRRPWRPQSAIEERRPWWPES